MGLVVSINSHRVSRAEGKPRTARQQLPLLLAQLLEAGATDFARIALDAWGREELDPEELVELCNTYASVAGLETLA